MNILAINSNNTFCANVPKSKFVTKCFDCSLINGDTAKVRFRHSGNEIKSLECYTFSPKGRYTGSRSFGKNPCLDTLDIISFFSDIQQKSSDNIGKKVISAFTK